MRALIAKKATDRPHNGPSEQTVNESKAKTDVFSFERWASELGQYAALRQKLKQRSKRWQRILQSTSFRSCPAVSTVEL